MHLDKDCITPVLDEYGYKRTAWVLAATLQELNWDGRFHPANKEWAARHYIPRDERHIADITVRSHPAVLDGFVTRWNRDEFIGVLDEQFLPEWAQEKLAELTAPRQEKTTTGEMKLE